MTHSPNLSLLFPVRMRPWHGEAVIYMTKDLKTGVTVKSILNFLEERTIVTTGTPSLGFLTVEEMIAVKSLPNPMDQMEEIISYLRKKEDRAFANFCTILEKSGHKPLSDKLKMKAAELKAAHGKCAQHFYTLAHKQCSNACSYLYSPSFMIPCFRCPAS